jgi:exosome complex component CSL4
MCSKSSDRKSGKFVVPGECLGVIEEFIPDTGTFVKDGKICSKVVGHALLDLLNKKVSVYPLVHAARVPKVGSTVVGQVSSVQPQNAVVRIFQIGGRNLTGVFNGFLHVSDAHMRFVDSMFDICKPGDIVRANVVSEMNRAYHLSTRDKGLGVVYAFCSRCGYFLEPKGYNMRCGRCGNVERRKTAVDYGKGVL